MADLQVFGMPADSPRSLGHLLLLLPEVCAIKCTGTYYDYLSCLSLRDGSGSPAVLSMLNPVCYVRRTSQRSKTYADEQRF